MLANTALCPEGEAHMKSRLISTAIAFALIGASFQMSAQERAKHHHYKLIDLGTFGGPESYINGFEYSGPLNNLNNAGTLAGWADTTTPDPYAPLCFNSDCFVSHAFQWRNGSRADLGVLPGGLSSATAWISASGLVAGASENGDLDPLYPGAPLNHAVLWRDGNIIDLGTLPEGGYESGAESVNSRGQVVGWAFNTVPDAYSMGSWSPVFNNYEPFPYPYQNRAFLWEDGVMRDLGTLGTGTDAFAVQINERGQVIGFSYTNSTPNPVITGCSGGGAPGGAMLPTQDPFLWEKGKMIDLGSLGGTCGFPYWLNDHGAVVGASDLAGDQFSHPFLWTKEKGMQDLGTLGGNYGQAQMINDRGEVVGGATLAGDSQTDAFLWNGTMHDLGALDGCSYAFAINSQRQVVGNWGGPLCAEGAFLWEDGGPMVDLSTLLSSASDLVLLVVSNNDRGEIAGIGVDASGNAHATVLVPCDENHRGIDSCDYSLVAATTAAEALRQSSSVANQNDDRPIGRRQRLNGRPVHRFSDARSPDN